MLFPSDTFRLYEKDAPASRHINVVGHIDNTTLIDKNGKLIRIIECQGIDFLTKAPAQLDNYKNRFNQLLKTIPSTFALYFWLIRKAHHDYPEGEFTDDFSTSVNARYYDKLMQHPLFQNRWYLGVVTKPPEGLLHQSVHVIKKFPLKTEPALQQAAMLEQQKTLNELTERLMKGLLDYQPRLLSTIASSDIVLSEPLSFLSEIMNPQAIKMPLTQQDASKYLMQQRLFFNRKRGIIEFAEHNPQRKFAAILTIKNYAAFTYQGVLDCLLKMTMEFTVTQSFRFYDRHVAKTKLRGQQKDLAQARDESMKQTDEINAAVDDTASGEISFGKHHFVVLVYAESLEMLNKNIAALSAQFSNSDLQLVREDIAVETSFWSQLPGNFNYCARVADISTKNMAALASFHNFAQGQKTNNHWGPCVTVFETLSKSPYYFNFHYRDVGNFLIFGSMGSGKTVLVGFLLLQSMKFGGKRIIFDKDRGLEIMVRAMGGLYQQVKPGIPTGFNPCQLSDTPDNRAFLFALFKKMLTTEHAEFIEGDVNTLQQAIEGLYRLPSADRTLRDIAPFFGAPIVGSLRLRWNHWIESGPYAWLFDHATDQLPLANDTMGFDISYLLTDTVCKIPAMMYLMHRIHQSFIGHRGIIFCDEGWNLLQDDYFKTELNDLSRTPRKKNNILGLATQVPEDTVASDVSKALNESASCKIFFPNPLANYDVYVTQLGLTEQEYQLIKTLPDNQHYFLLNYGRGKESVVLRLNLTGLENELAVISGRENTIQLLDSLREKVGNNPKDWLPLFYQQRPH